MLVKNKKKDKESFVIETEKLIHHTTVHYICAVVNHVDSDSKRIRQKSYQFFINEKFKKIFYSFTYILPNYVPLEFTKEFWKNSHFENVRADFLLRCQNSLRWDICLICHWNIDSLKQKLSFGYVMVPKNNQKII